MPIDLKDGTFVVKGAGPVSPGGLAGVRTGDVLAAVDHKAFEGEDPAKIKPMFEGPTREIIVLDVQRGQETKTISLVLKERLRVDGTLTRAAQ